MCFFLCSWDDSSSVSSGLSDTLDNLSTDDLNTTSSVSSYSNITASSRKNAHAQVSSFVAVCWNTPQACRITKEKVWYQCLWTNEVFISYKILYYTWTQEAIDSIDPTLGCELAFQIPCSQGKHHCWRCWLKTQPLLHPNTKQMQYDWICDCGFPLTSAHLEYLFQQITQ